MAQKKKLLFFCFLLLPLAVILTQCLGPQKTTDPRGEAFAGSLSCKKCHEAVYNSYLQTAHYATSRPADVKTIHGSFAAGHNQFDFGNGSKVVMEKRPDGIYQAGYINNKQVQAEKFGITIGGIKAETYLYWREKLLFELPMSYFDNLHSWTNSPGYDAGKIDFNRPIATRCLECHTSYVSEIENTSGSLTDRSVRFDNASIIYGIDCERCHGPAANHVNFHTEYPEVKQAKYISSGKSFTRQQKLDACAVCHSGNKEAYLRTAFAFKMGDTLAKFKEHNFFAQEVNPATLDVHGNQNGLLAASKCFIMSNMDCNSCHDTHKKESGNLAVFTQKCLSCHTKTNGNQCPLTDKLGTAIKTKCIDCHMPTKPSNQIAVETNKNNKLQVPYLVRTHYIAVYPQETKKVMAFIKGGR